MPEIIADDRNFCFDIDYINTKKANNDDFTNCGKIEYNKGV